MFKRSIQSELIEMARQYPVVTLNGPRQAGKTTLVQTTFPDLAYVNLEDPEMRELATQDPKAFFRLHPQRMIIDEIQRVPHLLSYIQTIVDQQQMMGQFILTGSHQLSLNQAISQSLAGRTALLNLLPLSIQELSQSNIEYTTEGYLHKGFLPRVHAGQMDPTKFYRNYFQTYVERDVRQMINIKNLSQFGVFLRLCAGRIGQLFNAHALANEVGIHSNTIKHWLSILEASFIVVRLQPFYENLGKRLVKTPKLYFTDVGLAAYLLGIENEVQLQRDPLKGNLFENLVVLELMKARANLGLDSNLYFYRDSNGHEVDLLFKQGQAIVPIEVKSAETFSRHFLKNITYFNSISGDRSMKGYVIYAGTLTPEYEQARVLNYRDCGRVVG